MTNMYIFYYRNVGDYNFDMYTVSIPLAYQIRAV